MDAFFAQMVGLLFGSSTGRIYGEERRRVKRLSEPGTPNEGNEPYLAGRLLVVVQGSRN